MNMKTFALATLSALVLASAAMAGPDCKVAYDRKCNFGAPSVFLPGQITSPIDIDNYCRQTSISCSTTECDARLNVMFGFKAGSPKTDSCLPAGYRGK